ncbi:ROK family protein [Roseateles sp.]|uniref:ROK family protein n=1 Tax=Roseateles sp. TaxID=1971397 RepID=UPI0025D23461|nr:ROK family protein [Roseateles sp.]MBV8035137.1 ROK family protein [Roseateles sp.]
MTRIIHGIDVGGTKIELVSYDEALQPLHRRRIDTPTQGILAFIEAVAGLVEEADDRLGAAMAVGVGIPGFVDPKTGCHVSANIPALRGQRVPSMLEASLKRPVNVANDCHCFALSEAHGGAAARFDSMFGLVIGTGAAGGYCVNGRLLKGRNGALGETGHTPISAAVLERHRLPIFDCACGLRGCLERYVSGSGLQAIHTHLSGEQLDGRGIMARASAGDATARQALVVHLDVLASSLASLVLHLDPDAIVLGGGLSKLSHLYEELPGQVTRHLVRGMDSPPILPPVFGDAGGTRGAAVLALSLLQSEDTRAC